MDFVFTLSDVYCIFVYVENVTSLQKQSNFYCSTISIKCLHADKSGCLCCLWAQILLCANIKLLCILYAFCSKFEVGTWDSKIETCFRVSLELLGYRVYVEELCTADLGGTQVWSKVFKRKYLQAVRKHF